MVNFPKTSGLDSLIIDFDYQKLQISLVPKLKGRFPLNNLLIHYFLDFTFITIACNLLFD